MSVSVVATVQVIEVDGRPIEIGETRPELQLTGERALLGNVKLRFGAAAFTVKATDLMEALKAVSGG